MPKIELSATEMLAFRQVQEQVQNLQGKIQSVLTVWRDALRDAHGSVIPLDARVAPSEDGKSVVYEWPDPTPAPVDEPDAEGNASEDGSEGDPEDAEPLG